MITIRNFWLRHILELNRKLIINILGLLLINLGLSGCQSRFSSDFGKQNSSLIHSLIARFTNSVTPISTGNSTNSSLSETTASPTPAVSLGYTLSSTTKDFGTQAQLETKTESFNLTNSGNVDYSQINFSTLGAPFSLSTGSCNTTLSIGASCTFSVNFTPTDSGTKSETLVITLSHSGSSSSKSVSISLLGEGNIQNTFLFSSTSSGSIETFYQNPTTGLITATGSIVTNSFTASHGLAVDPSGKFLYIANSGTISSQNASDMGDIRGYTINPETGSLTLISGGPFHDSQYAPMLPAIHPNGRFLYVSNYQSNTVTAFSMNRVTGALTVVGSVATCSRPQQIQIHPTGLYLYAACSNSGSVGQFTINPSTGAITAMGTSSVSTGQSWSNRLHMEKSGRYLYVSNYNSGSISRFDISQSNGGLSGVTQLSGYTTPTWITADHSNRFLFLNSGSNLNQYSLDVSTGAVTDTANPINVGSLMALQFDANNNFLYAAIGGSTCKLKTFQLNAATGLLTAHSSAPSISMSNSLCPYRIAFAKTSSQFLISSLLNSASIKSFRIIPSTGRLSLVGSITTGSSPAGLVVHPKGVVYVNNYASNTIGVHSISLSTGVLASSSQDLSLGAGSGPDGIALHPNTRFLYSAKYSSNEIGIYAISDTDQTLTSINSGSTSTGASSGPTRLAIEPTGRFLYVALNTDKSIKVYSIHPSSGELTLVETKSINPSSPKQLRTDFGGNYLYVTADTGNLVYVYSINRSTGALTSISTGSVATGTNPQDLAFDRTHQHAFCANGGSNTFSLFTIGSDGFLTAKAPAIHNLGTTPYTVLFDSSNRYIYAAEHGSGLVSLHNFSETDGSITTDQSYNASGVYDLSIH